MVIAKVAHDPEPRIEISGDRNVHTVLVCSSRATEAQVGIPGGDFSFWCVLRMCGASHQQHPSEQPIQFRHRGFSLGLNFSPDREAMAAH
jgi:hypothetical protein